MIVLQEFVDWVDHDEKTYVTQRNNLYAGLVMKNNGKNKNPWICRKILFSMNEDGTVNDLLYDTPNYPTKGTDDAKFYVDVIVKLEKLLNYYEDPEYLDEDYIGQIAQFFLSKNSSFKKEDARNLPISLKEYRNIEIISKFSKKPTRAEKKEVERFKAKVKTYTFR